MSCFSNRRISESTSLSTYHLSATLPGRPEGRPFEKQDTVVARQSYCQTEPSIVAGVLELDEHWGNEP